MPKSKPIKAWAIVSNNKIVTNDNGVVPSMLIFYKKGHALSYVWKENESVVEVSITRQRGKDAT